MSFATMIREAKIVVDKCIGVNAGENVTIFTDKDRNLEAQAIAGVANAIGANVLVVDITPIVVATRAGRYVDPPKHMQELIKSSNVTIIVTSQEYSQRFSHKIHYFLKQTPECCVYQVDEGLGTWDYRDEDIQLVMENSKKIMNAMKRAKWVQVTADNGTDIRLCIEGRECLPVMPVMPRATLQAATPIPLWGEYNWAPIEELSEGRVVVDGILMRFGSEAAVSRPVEWVVTDGRIVEIRGGDEADEFRRTLEEADENAYVIGELGIGGSHKARLGTMEEKGRLGTIHLGVGSNKGVYPGGKNVSKIHGDGSVRNVTIAVDGKVIVQKGRLVT